MNSKCKYHIGYIKASGMKENNDSSRSEAPTPNLAYFDWTG